MSGFVQVVIDNSTDKTVTGQWEFDRDSGGTLICPSGSSFPGTPVAKEWFWRTDESKLYRRNDANDAWNAVSAAAAAHTLGGASHTADTLSNLNTKINDLIATYGAIRDIGVGTDVQRPAAATAGRFWWATDSDKLYYDNGATWDTVAAVAAAHAASHENTGDDEISVAGLSGELADAQPPKAHDLGSAAHGADTLANLNLKVSDATLIDTADSRLSDARAPTAHDLGSAAHGADTLANLNLKVSDATLIDTADARLSDDRDPTAHASSHQSGGGDAIKLDDLSAPDDNTDLDASTSAHGLLLKLGGGTTNFLRADGSWQPPPGGVDTTAIHKATAAEISAMTSKASPVSADVFVIEDSEASYAKKKVLVSNLPGGVDTTAIHKATAAEISAFTEKTAPTEADWLAAEDAAASNAKKKIELGNLCPGNIMDLNEDIQVSESSTADTTWISKCTVTFTPKYTGVYFVQAACILYSSATSAFNWSEAQLLIDSAIHAYMNYFGTVPTMKIAVARIDGVATVETVVELQFRRGGSASTAYIIGAGVSVRRWT